MGDPLSRREFLKMSAAAVFAVMLDAGRKHAAAAAGTRLGRVAYSRVSTYAEPEIGAARQHTYARDTLLEIRADVTGGLPGDANRRWHLLAEGTYVHSGGIQPVEDEPNQAASSLPAAGTVGEITVPFTDSWWAVDRTPFRAARLYFASTHWIQSLLVEPRQGDLWYKAYDHHVNAYYYIRPEAVRILPPGDLAPLAAHVPPGEKSIEIRLDEQLLLAYESRQLAFSCRVSTGKGEFFTPPGEYTTFHKRPTAHMVGGESDAALYDLSGVPWNTYITENGIAMHGTFWHNDYGTPRSHGCINLTPQDARHIYRWTLPIVPPGKRFLYEPGQGTAVAVLASTNSIRRWIK